MIITEQIKKELSDTNQAYNKFDYFADNILSNIETLKEEFQTTEPRKSKIFKNYYEIMDYKIRQVYDTLMNLHDLVMNTTSRYYRKYHGPYRTQIGEGLFDEIRRNVTYAMEVFLTQLKTLLDLSIKFAFDTCFVGQNVSPIIDSLGKFFTRIYAQKRKASISTIWKTMKKSKLFSEIVKNKIHLYQIETYRNHIIHQGYLELQISHISEQKEITFDYKIPKLTWMHKTKIDPNIQYDLTSFCREMYYLVLHVLLEITEKMFDKAIIKKHMKILLQFRHEDVLEILKKLSKKGRWSEEWFDSEIKIKDFLREYNINMNELIIENYVKHDSSRKYRNRPNFVNFTERTTYKPIKGIQVYKTKSTSGIGSDITEFGWHYHVLKIDVPIEEYSKIPHSDKILECLRRCNLLFLTNKNPKRYGSLKGDLKKFFSDLENLNFIKWSEIQYQEFTHLRELNEEEKEEMKKLRGKEDESYLKKIAQEREKLYSEYVEWKKNPYSNKTIHFQTDTGLPVFELKKEDYFKELGRDFINWKDNKVILTDDRGSERIQQLFSAEKFNEKSLKDLINQCYNLWKKKSYNYYLHLLNRSRKTRKEYSIKVLKIRNEHKRTIAKYMILQPLLELMNYDVYHGVDFSKVNAKIWMPEISS